MTCEHGGNQIPENLKHILKIPDNILNSHEGLDIGALDLAKYLVKYFESCDFVSPLVGADLFVRRAGQGEIPFFYSEISRLVIELNRSLHHPKLFSRFSKKYLSPENKINLMTDFYKPYRAQIENKISDLIKKNNLVIHLSIHSFTPVLNNKKRDLDIGLLYDPQNLLEKKFCKIWQGELEKLNFKTRKNYPYRGNSDGLTSYLRKQFKNNYLGIELETNQALWHGSSPQAQENLFEQIAQSIQASIQISLSKI